MFSLSLATLYEYMVEEEVRKHKTSNALRSFVCTDYGTLRVRLDRCVLRTVNRGGVLATFFAIKVYEKNLYSDTNRRQD